MTRLASVCARGEGDVEGVRVAAAGVAGKVAAEGVCALVRQGFVEGVQVAAAEISCEAQRGALEGA